ncbi:MAG: hypothetical protein ACTSU2_15290 [Promethearchaeota archaeon]
MSSIEDLKKQLAIKERSIKILHMENENLKKKLAENSNITLNKKIELLNKELNEKKKEIEELKKLNSTGSGGVSSRASGGQSAGDEVQELKTRIIILQSKVRKANREIEKLKEENDNLKVKIRIMEKQQGKQDDINELKKAIEDYQRKIARYKGEISDLRQSAEYAKSLEAEVRRLKQELAQKSSMAGSTNEFEEFQSDTDQKLVQKLKQMLNERDQKIQELTEELASNSRGMGGGFLSQNRFNRKIAELEAQIKMLKKSESQMRQRYEEAMRKLAMKDEFADW